MGSHESQDDKGNEVQDALNGPYSLGLVIERTSIKIDMDRVF